MKVSGITLLSGSALLFSVFFQATAAGATVRLPKTDPNTKTPTPNTIAISRALQHACDQLSAPTNAGSLTPAQQDLLQQCAFFQDPATSDAALINGYANIGGQQINALGPQTKKFSTLQQDDVTSRLAELRHGTAGVSPTTADLTGDYDHLLAADGSALADAVAAGGSQATSTFMNGRLGVYLNGAFQSGTKHHSPNSFAFDISDDMVTAGADYRVTDWFVAGAAYGHGKTQTDFKLTQDAHKPDPGGRVDLTADGFNLYGSFYHSTYYLDLLVGYSSTDVNSDRPINYANTTSGTTIAQAATGTSHSHELWAGFSLGDSLYWKSFFAVPEFSLNFHEIQLSSFTESVSQPGAPGNGLALHYGEGVIPSLQGRLGLHLGYNWSTGWGIIQPQIHGTFVREFRDNADTFAVSFVAAPGPPALIHTDKPEPHYWAYGGGISAQLAHGVAAFVDYEELRTLKTIESHEFQLGLRWQIGE